MHRDRQRQQGDQAPHHAEGRSQQPVHRPQADCGDSRGQVCKDYSEWTQAWTEIKG